MKTVAGIFATATLILALAIPMAPANAKPSRSQTLPDAPLAQSASASASRMGPTQRGYVVVTADGLRVGVVERVLSRRAGIVTVIITMDNRVPTPVRKFSVPVARHMRGDGLVLLDQSERELLRSLRSQIGI